MSTAAPGLEREREARAARVHRTPDGREIEVAAFSAPPSTFGLLPDPPSRLRSLGAGALAEMALIAVAVTLGTWQMRTAFVQRSFNAVQVALPPAKPPRQRPATHHRAKATHAAHRPHVRASRRTMVAHAPALHVPKIVRRPEPPAPKVQVARIPVAPPVLVPAPMPAVKLAPQVKVGVLADAAGRPAASTPRKEVRTGGFGDPNGLTPAQSQRSSVVAVAGAFDRPAGDATGGRSAGAVSVGGFGAGSAASTAGVRGGGGVQTAGFGSGAAARTGPVPHGGVQSAGFNAQTAAPATPARAAVAPRETPVEVLSKPVPAYTDEARRLGIEGEVVLEVAFGANGELRVIRVVRGLGHGLDQEARRAAERLRFRPALRDGHPVDSVSTLRIVFQLA